MRIPQPPVARTLAVTSPAFAEGQPIPARFTCAGDGTSPAFVWTGVPAGTVEVAVIVSDPDAPRGTFLHWLVYGLPPRDGGFAEGRAPEGAHQGVNSARTADWCPPCPPSGTHRYIVAVHALDARIAPAPTEQVLAAIGRHTLAWGTLTGTVTAR